MLDPKQLESINSTITSENALDLINFKQSIPHNQEIDEENDFFDVSTVCYTPRSFDSELEKEIRKHFSSSFDSDLGRVLPDENVSVDVNIETELENNPSSSSNMEKKGAIPAFECSKYIPKIGPKEYKPKPTTT
jgi:hypothetical protein